MHVLNAFRSPDNAGRVTAESDFYLITDKNRNFSLGDGNPPKP
jgi:hypothetical protein